MVFLSVQQLCPVPAVDYEGETLVAYAQTQLLKSKRDEMQGHVKCLQAFPFRELDDSEFLDVNVRPITDSKGFSKDNGKGVDKGNSYSCWGSESDDETCAGWGADDWFSSSVSSDGSSPSGSDDDPGFQTPFVPISEAWDCPHQKRYAYTEIAHIIAKLKWKFPRAFEGNETTVSHTEEALQPYLEAADFLIGQTRRHRIQRQQRQRRAHMRATQVQYTAEQRKVKSPKVDWDEVLRDYTERMAKRKMHKKSPLSREP